MFRNFEDFVLMQLKTRRVLLFKFPLTSHVHPTKPYKNRAPYVGSALLIDEPSLVVETLLNAATSLPFVVMKSVSAI